MTEADQTAMMMALQKELAEMKKAHEETAKRMKRRSKTSKKKTSG